MPLGINVAMNERRDLNLVVEATYLQGKHNDGADQGAEFLYQGGFASAGASYRLVRWEGGGLFLQGKLAGTYVGWRLPQGRRTSSGTSWSLGPAADFGVEQTWGPLYLAAVIGVGVQYFSGKSPNDWIAFPQASSETSGSGIQPMFNPNLLRVGFAW